MKLNISHLQFEELIKKSYSLDLIYLLKLIEDNYDVESLCKRSVKISTLYATLLRKGLISEAGESTIIGKDLLQYAESDKNEKFIKKKADDTGFEKWWKIYPSTDTFMYKGMKFTGSRGLRQARTECKRKFNDILMEGKYTEDQLIKALEYDVLQKKEKSVESKTNKLAYMQNSLTYLNKKSFEAFIELINMEKETHERLSNLFNDGATDI